MLFLPPDQVEQHLRLGGVVGTPPLRDLFQYESSVVLVWDTDGVHLRCVKDIYKPSVPTLLRMLNQCLHTFEGAHQRLLLHGDMGEYAITALLNSPWDNTIIDHWRFPIPAPGLAKDDLLALGETFQAVLQFEDVYEQYLSLVDSIEGQKTTDYSSLQQLVRSRLTAHHHSEWCGWTLRKHFECNEDPLA